MGLCDFSKHKTEDLQRAEKLYTELKEMELAFIDEDGIADLEDELKLRETDDESKCSCPECKSESDCQYYDNGKCRLK